jgi:hypothetical protein
MTTRILKIRSRCCWLPLIAFCATLPAVADQLEYSVGSGKLASPNGSITVSGFAPSLGTLDSVAVELRFSLFPSLINKSPDAVKYAVSYDLDETFTQPDGSTALQQMSDSSFSSGSAAPGGLQLDELNERDTDTFTDQPTLEEYTTPNVTLNFSGDSPLTPGSTLNGLEFVSFYDLFVDVTYDYTPAVSAVPEPTAVLLLGTLAAVCLWAFRRRLALRR